MMMMIHVGILLNVMTLTKLIFLHNAQFNFCSWKVRGWIH